MTAGRLVGMARGFLVLVGADQCVSQQEGWPCKDMEEQTQQKTKKADGASKTALLIPIPPAVTGKETCFHAEIYN